MKELAKMIYKTAYENATSRTYAIPYAMIENESPIDMCSENVQHNLSDVLCANYYQDKISSWDFDNVRKEVIVMLYNTKKTEEEKKMKKYTLKQYEEFCRDALVCPPFEVDDQDELDEWFEEHKITIRTENHEIELEYDADVINEIEFSLKEMHEALYGDGTPTTGNTQGSQYRPAEFKDVVRWYITTEYERVLGRNYNLYAQNAVDKLSQMHHFSRIYQEILGMTCQNEKYGCDFARFNPVSLKDATRDGIKKIVLDWVGTHIETSYDSRTDKTFIIDYTFKEAGDFIGWFWGEPNDEDIKYYVNLYKLQIFEEN